MDLTSFIENGLTYNTVKYFPTKSEMVNQLNMFNSQNVQK